MSTTAIATVPCSPGHLLPRDAGGWSAPGGASASSGPRSPGLHRLNDHTLRDIGLAPGRLESAVRPRTRGR